MCQEVFELVQNMDLRSVELQLALQCAPLITGIKISNLLIIPQESEDALRVVLKKSGISYFRLAKAKDKMMFLLFRRRALEAYLGRKEVCAVFTKCGYTAMSLGSILRTFRERYCAYIEQKALFPHEMGLLLGYPIEDVTGFITHKGRKFLYSGYWKVYDDVEAKKKLFFQYEEAKETLIQLLASEIDMRVIFEIYQDTPGERIAG